MKKPDDILFDYKTINAIVEYLSPFKCCLIKNKLYYWKGKNFEETIEIRKELSGELKAAKKENFDAFCKVCKEVLKWGGINNITDDNLKKMAEIFFNNQELKDFKRISSNSKIASFLDPNEYIIYDSRVSYTINWILLDKCNSNVYFPMPNSRNRKINTFDMKKIIQHYKNGKIEADNGLFIKEEKAYCTLNKLVKKVHEKLWGKKYSELYYTEMILFSIVDKCIYDYIIKWACEKF